MALPVLEHHRRVRFHDRDSDAAWVVPCGGDRGGVADFAAVHPFLAETGGGEKTH